MIKEKSQLTREEILEEIKILTLVSEKNRGSFWHDTPANYGK
jgi:hypothetical protein